MSTTVGLNIWLAGAFAGLSINLLVFPLDTLKTRLQSSFYREAYKSSIAIGNRALYRGLYQGIGTVVCITVPSSGVFFTTYEGLKYVLGSSWISQPAVHAISSSIAQLLNCAIMTPAEVLKLNAQTFRQDEKNFRQFPTMDALRRLRKHPANLWRGYTALVARDLPFTALQFPVFEYLKKTMIARRTRQSGGGPVPGILERTKISAASAAIAGSAAAWVTTPFDVVKTRMMLDSGAKNLNMCKVAGLRVVRHGEAAGRNGLQICKEVVQNEGIKGLFRGGLIRAAYTILGNGLYMGCYEGARFYLEDRQKVVEKNELRHVRSAP